jgi:tetratricopeptide (TPR) repeat protein
MEEEVAEEVLEVEPLEVEPQSMEELFSDIDFLSQDDAGEPAFAREEQEEEETGSLAAEDGQREGHAEEAAFPAGVFEESAEEPFVEGAAALPEQEAASGQAGESSDDFTTDTLAELYIAQGFYEKAIDIYERMLADHPDSSGLREKLERVRAMAVSTEAPPAAEPAGPSQTEREEGLADFGPGPPDLGEPAVERPLYADFEPREYVPPVTGLAEAEENQSSAEEPGKAIARLEKWLANIARER